MAFGDTPAHRAAGRGRSERLRRHRPARRAAGAPMHAMNELPCRAEDGHGVAAGRPGRVPGRAGLPVAAAQHALREQRRAGADPPRRRRPLPLAGHGQRPCGGLPRRHRRHAQRAAAGAGAAAAVCRSKGACARRPPAARSTARSCAPTWSCRAACASSGCASSRCRRWPSPLLGMDVLGKLHWRQSDGVLQHRPARSAPMRARPPARRWGCGMAGSRRGAFARHAAARRRRPQTQRGAAAGRHSATRATTACCGASARTAASPTCSARCTSAGSDWSLPGPQLRQALAAQRRAGAGDRPRRPGAGRGSCATPCATRAERRRGRCASACSAQAEAACLPAGALQGLHADAAADDADAAAGAARRARRRLRPGARCWPQPARAAGLRIVALESVAQQVELLLPADAALLDDGAGPARSRPQPRADAPPGAGLGGRRPGRCWSATNTGANAPTPRRSAPGCASSTTSAMRRWPRASTRCMRPGTRSSPRSARCT